MIKQTNFQAVDICSSSRQWVSNTYNYLEHWSIYWVCVLLVYRIVMGKILTHRCVKKCEVNWRKEKQRKMMMEMNQPKDNLKWGQWVNIHRLVVIFLAGVGDVQGEKRLGDCNLHSSGTMCQLAMKAVACKGRQMSASGFLLSTRAKTRRLKQQQKISTSVCFWSTFQCWHCFQIFNILLFYAPVNYTSAHSHTTFYTTLHSLLSSSPFTTGGDSFNICCLSSTIINKPSSKTVILSQSVW